MSKEVSFDAKSALKARHAIDAVIVDVSHDIEQPLRRLHLPEMPAATHSEVAALIASAISSMANARVGVAHVSGALRTQTNAMGEYDKLAKLPWWVGAGDTVGRYGKGPAKFFGADLILTGAGGVDVSTSWDPRKWDWQASHATLTERGIAVVNFAMTVSMVNEVRGLAAARGASKTFAEKAFIREGEQLGLNGTKARAVTVVDRWGRPLQEVTIEGLAPGYKVLDEFGRVSKVIPRLKPIGRPAGTLERQIIGLDGRALRVPHPAFWVPAGVKVYDALDRGRARVAAEERLENVESLIWDAPDGQLKDTQFRQTFPNFEPLVWSVDDGFFPATHH